MEYHVRNCKEMTITPDGRPRRLLRESLFLAIHPVTASARSRSSAMEAVELFGFFSRPLAFAKWIVGPVGCGLRLRNRKQIDRSLRITLRTVLRLDFDLLLRQPASLPSLQHPICFFELGSTATITNTDQPQPTSRSGQYSSSISADLHGAKLSTPSRGSYHAGTAPRYWSSCTWR